MFGDSSALSLMTSVLSIVSLTLTTISAIVFVGLFANYIQSSSIPLGYFALIAGFVLSVISMLVGDRTWVSKVSLGLAVSVLLAVCVSIMWGLRNAGH
jgi:hypothetical protein